MELNMKNKTQPQIAKLKNSKEIMISKEKEK